MEREGDSDGGWLLLSSPFKLFLHTGHVSCCVATEQNTQNTTLALGSFLTRVLTRGLLILVLFLPLPMNVFSFVCLFAGLNKDYWTSFIKTQWKGWIILYIIWLSCWNLEIFLTLISQGPTQTLTPLPLWVLLISHILCAPLHVRKRCISSLLWLTISSHGTIQSEWKKWLQGNCLTGSPTVKSSLHTGHSIQQSERRSHAHV